MNRRKRAPLACLFVLCASRIAAAQMTPAEPIMLAGGAVTFGGDISATIGPEDPGFFNYTDYEDSVLRMLRVDLTTSVRAGKHLSLHGELRSQNARMPRAYALYFRVRPWAERRFDIQIGRIPPTFGAFPRRNYETDNPLIGYPLAYQYLTSIRADAIPGSADELVQMRGRGWLATYSIPELTAAPGVPLVNALRWDTGVQGHVANDLLEFSASVTSGTLSNPLFRDDNAGRQFAARGVVRPIAGLIVGASGAHGPFVSREAARAAAGSEHDGAFSQTAWGGDVEYSRGYYVVRAETIVSRWTLPLIDDRLTAVATTVEGRYKIRPGFYVAARVDHLGFNRIATTTGSETWDAPVTRYEAGGGYSIQRNLLMKLSVQHDQRDGGRTRTANLAAGQLVFWF
jgi:hypothetical protein